MAVFIEKDIQRRRNGFDQIPNENLRGMGELSDFAFRVYMFLHSQAEVFEPTESAVSKALRKSAAAVQRAFNELKLYGYLEQERTGRKYRYIIREDPKRKP